MYINKDSTTSIIQTLYTQTHLISKTKQQPKNCLPISQPHFLLTVMIKRVIIGQDSRACDLASRSEPRELATHCFVYIYTSAWTDL